MDTRGSAAPIMGAPRYQSAFNVDRLREEGAMNGNTWGIAGPVFVNIYGGLIGLAVLFAAYQCLAPVVTPGGRWLGKASRPIAARPRDRYSMAYLAGGTARVAAAAVAGLLTAGAVRVNRSGQVCKVAEARGADSFESAALDTVRRAGGATMRQVSAGFSRRDESWRHAPPVFGAPGMEAIESRLVADGLLSNQYRQRRNRILVAFGAVLLLGALRMIAGIANGRPVEKLAVEMAIAGVTGYLLLKVLPDRALPTRMGKAVIKSMRAHYTGLAGPEAVAALGLKALGDPQSTAHLSKGGRHVDGWLVETGPGHIVVAGLASGRGHGGGLAGGRGHGGGLAGGRGHGGGLAGGWGHGGGLAGGRGHGGGLAGGWVGGGGGCGGGGGGDGGGGGCGG